MRRVPLRLPWVVPTRNLRRPASCWQLRDAGISRGAGRRQGWTHLLGTRLSQMHACAHTHVSQTHTCTLMPTLISSYTPELINVHVLTLMLTLTHTHSYPHSHTRCAHTHTDTHMLTHTHAHPPHSQSTRVLAHTQATLLGSQLAFTGGSQGTGWRLEGSLCTEMSPCPSCDRSLSLLWASGMSLEPTSVKLFPNFPGRLPTALTSNSFARPTA